MKNTYIAMDMLFIRGMARGGNRGAHDAFSEKTIQSPERDGVWSSMRIAARHGALRVTVQVTSDRRLPGEILKWARLTARSA